MMPVKCFEMPNKWEPLLIIKTGKYNSDLATYLPTELLVLDPVLALRFLVL